VSVAVAYDDSALRRKLAAKIRALTNIDYSPILEDIGEIGVRDSINRIQSTKVDPSGNAWAPWSAGYARSGRGSTLEHKSGDLMAAIGSFVSGEDEVTIHADLAYAARQQFGFHGTDSLGRRVNHPAREYLGLSAEAANDVGLAVARHIRDTFNGAA
jgi:phage gpG-like protein